MNFLVRVGPSAVVRLQLPGGEHALGGLLASYLVDALELGTDTVYEVPVYNEPPFRAREDGEIEASGDHFVFRFNPETRVAQAFLFGEIPPWQIACPLRQLFSWIVAHAGGVLLHAAGVYWGGGAVLLSGPSGSGKSTLAFHASTFGANKAAYLGDDWVAIARDPQGGHFRAFGLYNSLKLAPGLGKPSAMHQYEHKGKRVYRSFATSFDRGVSALVVPKVGAALYMNRLTPFEALERVAPSTLLQSSGVPPQTLGTIAELCQSVRCYELSSSEHFLPSVPALLKAMVG